MKVFGRGLIHTHLQRLAYSAQLYQPQSMTVLCRPAFLLELLELTFPCRLWIRHLVYPLQAARP